MFTDGSVVSAFSARDGDTTVSVREMSGATEVTTYSMYMEVIAITESLKWLKDTEFESATIVTDSVSTLEKVKNGMLYADLKEAIRGSNLSIVVTMFCPGHASVAGNESAEKLAGDAVLGEAFPLDPTTVVAMLTDWYNNNRVVAPSHTIDVLNEKKYKRGEGRKCDLRGAARRCSMRRSASTP